jgi:aspartyl-tRNA synthetase
MIGGYDRYFQLAPCMRDEDSRADRIYGVHYQFDIEMSFVGQEDIITMLEKLYIQTIKTLGESRGLRLKNDKFPRMRFQEALEKYGSDKPDIRYGLEIVDITDIARDSEFQVFKNSSKVRGIKIDGGATKLSRKDIDDMIAYSKTLGSGGMAWMKVNDEGKLDSNIVKFFSEDLQAQIIAKFEAKAGDMLFYIADTFDRSCVYLDKIRRKLAEDLKLYDPNEIAFVWIVDMPFFEWNEEENKLDISHNPFSKPGCTKEEFLNAKTKEEMLAIKARQYDLACNGLELFSGGERNYDPEILDKVFEIIGYRKEEIDESFGHMLKAFKYGAPPTAGAGMGIERMMMVITKEVNIKNIVAFPHNQKGYDPMMKSPRTAKENQLKELGLQVKKKAQ